MPVCLTIKLSWALGKGNVPAEIKIKNELPNQAQSRPTK
jgi:hypothetical protein